VKKFMTDQIVIQSIHPEVKQAVVVFNIEGKTYPKVLPFLTTTDADLLKQQLQAFAKELKTEFDALTAAVQQADQNAVPPVSDAVNALVGQSFDAADDTTPTDGGATDAGNNASTPPDGGATDAGNNADTTGGVDTTDNGNANAGDGNATSDNGNGTPAA
jgi:hypothetical protein